MNDEREMKAWVYTRYGPPEVVQLKTVERPLPKDNEVLIRIHATTVNRTDCGFRSAEYFISRFFTGLLKPKNQILGNEFAGEIVAVGTYTNTYKIGDRVFGYNDRTMGGHAQYLALPETATFTTIPSDMSYSEAAPICEGSHYALCDIRAAKVKSGQRTLVYGATGAIGSAAVQLLKHFGAHVTAVCHTNYIDLVKSLGADEVIDYTKSDYTNTQNKYDLVFDAVGKTSFGKCKPVLTEKGIYISTELGKNSENIRFAISTSFFKGKRVLFPIPTFSHDDLNFLKTLVEKKIYRPVLDRIFKFEEMHEAYHFVETGQKIGNVVITVE